MIDGDSKALDEFASRSFPVRENMRLQKGEWFVERVAWGVTALVIALALFGLFSRGPLSEAVARGTDGNLQVAYERFIRSQSLTRFVVTATTDAERPVLHLGAGFAKAFELRAIQPLPSESFLDEAGARYVFSGRPARSSIVIIDAKRTTWGSSSAAIGFGIGAEVLVSQFAYP